MPSFTLGAMQVDVVHKSMKTMRLSVHSPDGAVRVAAPFNVNLRTIQAFVEAKLDWIKKQQVKLAAQPKVLPRHMITGEQHYYNGSAYQLVVIERQQPAKVISTDTHIILMVRPGASEQKRRAILNEWYRQQLKKKVPDIIAHYEPLMKVTVSEFGVKQMKTRWGTCNPLAQRIWVNLELAQKPAKCLEYLVVHEMVHLLEHSHNHRFVAFMDYFLPDWRIYKNQLNQFPV